MKCAYLDTSVVVKGYVEEAGSDEYQDFLNAEPVRFITGRLTMAELCSLLAGRRRAGDFDAAYEVRAFHAFSAHVTLGVLEIVAMPDVLYAEAAELIRQLTDVPLRTLDALHLAAARAAGASLVVTADRGMRDAARALGIEVRFFGTAEAA